VNVAAWSEHLAIVPILLPLVTAAVLLFIDERRRRWKAAIGIAATLGLLCAAIALLVQADALPPGAPHATHVYLVANWPAAFGIVLAVDRLAATMLVLTATLALAALVFASVRWQRAGSHFHSLFQIQLMGLAGAFLTGDLFNLFVFFEILLAASYGLTLHGSGLRRVKAGLHYIAINLLASSLFLIGASLIYGVAGTLGMAELAARVPTLAADERLLFETGTAIFAIAILVKAAVWPLNLWLPTTYAAASAPVAAMFAILSKVGVYVVVRLWLLLFGAGAGESAQFGREWLLVGGIATIVSGAIGVYASRDLKRLAGFSVLVSAGTLLAVVGAGGGAVVGSALFYLVSSTLGLGAFFLLIELVERSRDPVAQLLAVTAEAFGEEEEDPFGEEDEVGVAVPGIMALLGLGFLCCAVLLAGLPPLSGFVAKFAMLSLLLGADDSWASWALVGVVIASGLLTVLAMAREGVRSFWVSGHATLPRVRVAEIAPIVLLVGLCVVLTVQAGPVMDYLQATAASLESADGYIDDVQSARPVAPPAVEASR
jgi:multicomponent K+:H+ antiporter subunit D